MRRLSKKQLDIIAKATLKKSVSLGLKHAEENLPYIKKSILDLQKERDPSPPDSAIVISAGPSLHRKNVAKKILRSNWKGEIITTDGAMGYCLRNGLVPDYVITVDPHPTRIIRWFGDPYLERRKPDDYFQRQDLDPSWNKDEIKRNKETIKLVNKYGPKIKVIISTSVSPEITKRCLEAGMSLYWWNPLYDDYRRKNSYSHKIYRLTKVPCMVTGGNSGTSAWVFSQAILKSKYIALLGMDLSYPPKTPIKRTQYYKELLEIFGKGVKESFIKIYNPYLKETWYTDPTYYWYRKGLLDLVNQAECITYNCTEGGILFGKKIKFAPLSHFLKRYGKDTVY